MLKYIPLVVILISAASQSYAAAIPVFVSKFLKEDNLTIGTQYQNHFESISEFSGHYIAPQNHKNTASHDLSNVNSVDGGNAHRAWIYGQNQRQAGVNTNHRAYPTFQMKKTNLGIVTTTVLVDIWVWADIDMDVAEDKSWFSIATLTSYDDIYWPRSYLINVDRNYKMHVMHVPNHAESHPDIFMTRDVEFPRREWVRVTTLIDYTKNNRFSKPIIAVWQDEVLIAASYLNDRIDPFTLSGEDRTSCFKSWNQVDIGHVEQLCGLNYTGGLAQMHFGLYAPPLISSGTIYNDELVVSEIVRR